MPLPMTTTYPDQQEAMLQAMMARTTTCITATTKRTARPGGPTIRVQRMDGGKSLPRRLLARSSCISTAAAPKQWSPCRWVMKMLREQGRGQRSRGRGRRAAQQSSTSRCAAKMLNEESAAHVKRGHTKHTICLCDDHIPSRICLLAPALDELMLTCPPYRSCRCEGERRRRVFLYLQLNGPQQTAVRVSEWGLLFIKCCLVSNPHHQMLHGIKPTSSNATSSNATLMKCYMVSH